MKFIRRRKEITKAFKEAYKKSHKMDYKKGEKFEENIPVYHLVDNDFNPVIKERKVWSTEKDGYVILKEAVVYTQFRINSLIKMGQKIEIFTDRQIKKEKEAFEALINRKVEERLNQMKK